MTLSWGIKAIPIPILVLSMPVVLNLSNPSNLYDILKAFVEPFNLLHKDGSSPEYIPKFLIKNRNFSPKWNKLIDKRYIILTISRDVGRLTFSRCQIILDQNDVQYSIEVTQIFIKVGCSRVKIKVKAKKVYKFKSGSYICKGFGFSNSMVLSK